MGIEHGALNELKPSIAEMMFEVVPFSYGEVIQNDNLVPRVKQGIHQMGSNESCSAGDQ